MAHATNYQGAITFEIIGNLLQCLCWQENGEKKRKKNNIRMREVFNLDSCKETVCICGV